MIGQATMARDRPRIQLRFADPRRQGGGSRCERHPGCQRFRSVHGRGIPRASRRPAQRDGLQGSPGSQGWDQAAGHGSVAIAGAPLRPVQVDLGCPAHLRTRTLVQDWGPTVQLADDPQRPSPLDGSAGVGSSPDPGPARTAPWDCCVTGLLSQVRLALRAGFGAEPPRLPARFAADLFPRPHPVQRTATRTTHEPGLWMAGGPASPLWTTTWHHPRRPATRIAHPGSHQLTETHPANRPLRAAVNRGQSRSPQPPVSFEPAEGTASSHGPAM